MSAPIQDGGPAFPCLPPDANPNAYAQFPSGMGMTLRDWFAGKALTGMLSSPLLKGALPDKKTAQFAYEIADAMIAAREESK